MKLLRHLGCILVAVGCLYAVVPLFIFELSSVAVPFDEDSYNGRQVAIGPRPRAWVPGASHDFDIPGGYGYAASGWPFKVWKPLCLGYLSLRGYERPAAWRPSREISEPLAAGDTGLRPAFIPELPGRGARAGSLAEKRAAK